MKTQAFVCRVKPDGKTDLSDQALNEDCIYYGLPDIDGLLDHTHTIETIRLAIHDIHPEYIPLREAKMFWIFSRTIQTNDLILVPKRVKAETVYFLARADGDAYLVPEKRENFTTHRRNVQWLNFKKPFRKTDLSKELVDFMNQPFRVTHTCLNITEFADVLKRLAGSLSKV